MVHESLRRLAAQRNECAQPWIAQEKPSPNQHAENDRREEGIANAQVSGGGAAQIAGQEDCAKNGCARNHIEDRADELDYPEPERRSSDIRGG
jgi:hypothetical protein